MSQTISLIEVTIESETQEPMIKEIEETKATYDRKGFIFISLISFEEKGIHKATLTFRPIYG